MGAADGWGSSSVNRRGTEKDRTKIRKVKQIQSKQGRSNYFFFLSLLLFLLFLTLSTFVCLEEFYSVIERKVWSYC
jgi:hypothetical protein